MHSASCHYFGSPVIAQARRRIRHPSGSLLVAIQMNDTYMREWYTEYFQACLDMKQIRTHVYTYTYKWKCSFMLSTFQYVSMALIVNRPDVITLLEYM